MIRLAPFKKLATRLLEMTLEQIMGRYQIPFEEAQTLAPALEVYLQMAEHFKVKRLMVCGVSLRDGLLSSVLCENAWDDGFIAQINHSVAGLIKQYQVDETHADLVCYHATQLFDLLKAEHHLGSRDLVILQVAAKLHDVGRLISPTGHHKHSQYIIENSTVFGLSESDMRMSAMVARYHRGALPRETHQDYSRLPRTKRLIVKQLAAILRVADALDCSRFEQAHHVTLNLSKRQLEIKIDSGPCAAEKRALVAKGRLFEQVYGRDLVLNMGHR